MQAKSFITSAKEDQAANKNNVNVNSDDGNKPTETPTEKLLAPLECANSHQSYFIEPLSFIITNIPCSASEVNLKEDRIYFNLDDLP